MPKENDWILFGPFADKSQIRNKFTYDLARKLGSYQPRSKFCELIMNGELLGLYCLTENIKRDSNRVNIAKLKEDEISGVEVTGGYIMKYDKPNGDLQFVYPKPENVQPEQSTYINSFLNEYRAVLNSDHFMDQTQGFRKYMCDSSFVDFIIMNELAKNADSYLYSTYFYKDREDRDNRIKYGPLWDFDLGYGNTEFQNGKFTYGWQFERNQNMNITRFLQDVTLVEQLQDRWHDLRNSTLSSDSIFAFMDTLLSYIEPAKDRNYRVWPVIGERLFYPGYNVYTYDEEIATMKSWLTTRIVWIDENIDLIYYTVNITENNIGTFQINIYPNPFRDRLNLSIEVENEAALQIEITNLLGQVQFNMKQNVYAGYSEIEINDRAVSALPKGMYIVRAFLNNMLISTQKVLKN
jgi:hypothetical protein